MDEFVVFYDDCSTYQDIGNFFLSCFGLTSTIVKTTDDFISAMECIVPHYVFFNFESTHNGMYIFEALNFKKLIYDETVYVAIVNSTLGRKMCIKWGLPFIEKPYTLADIKDSLKHRKL